MKNDIETKLRDILSGIGAASVLADQGSAPIKIDYPENPEHGDFTTNVALMYAKKLDQSPKALAEKIVEEFKVQRGAQFDLEIGDAAIDGLINELAKKVSSAETEHLLHEILTTAVKLGMESCDTGDLKLVNNTLKELRYSFKIFSPYRNIKKVIIFG